MGEIEDDLFLRKDAEGDTYLHLVVANQEHEAVRGILNDGRCPKILNSKNNEGQTALHLAVVVGDQEITGLLLDMGADPSLQNNRGETALHIAVTLGKNECLQTVLSKSSKNLELFEIQDNDGNAVLHCAIIASNNDAVKFLLDNQADVNCKNGKTGFTALHYATKSNQNNQNIIEILMQFNPDVNAQSNDGNAPLHFLTNKEQRPIADLLLGAGADVYLKNNNDQSPHSLSDKTMQRHLQRNRLDRKTRRSRASKDSKKELDETEEDQSFAVAAKSEDYSLKKRKMGDFSNPALASAGSAPGRSNAFPQDFINDLLDVVKTENSMDSFNFPNIQQPNCFQTSLNYQQNNMNMPCASSVEQLPVKTIFNSPQYDTATNSLSFHNLQSNGLVTTGYDINPVATGALQLPVPSSVLYSEMESLISSLASNGQAYCDGK